jgi:hypothetical protein
MKTTISRLSHSDKSLQRRHYGGIAPRRLTFRPLKGAEALSWGQVQCSGEKTSFHAESAEPKKGRGPMIEGVISDLSRDLSPNELMNFVARVPEQAGTACLRR